MKEILISGSTAYDTHVQYDGDFTDQFENSTLQNALNFSLIASKVHKHEGGTAANIAYNLCLLGENPVLLSSIGSDFNYEGIISERSNLKYIHISQKQSTANSYIFFDKSDNRMTLFYPGAMEEASASKIDYVTEEIGYAIVSANHIPTMLEHAKALHSQNIKIIVDPAQQISQMSYEEIQEFLSYAEILIVNHYELQQLQALSGYTKQGLQSLVSSLIVTYGDKGSEIFTEGKLTHIDAIEVSDIDDTTGTGDAYRAGVLKALIEGYDIITGCKLGTIAASYCVLTQGSQTHHFNFSTIMEDMKTYFSIEIDLYKKRKY